MPIMQHNTIAAPSPLVAALLYDGLCTFEFGIVAEVFGLYRPEMGVSWYRFISCAIEPGPLHANGGFTIIPDQGAEALEKADIIVVLNGKAQMCPCQRYFAKSFALLTHGAHGLFLFAQARLCWLQPDFLKEARLQRIGAMLKNYKTAIRS